MDRLDLGTSTDVFSARRAYWNVRWGDSSVEQLALESNAGHKPAVHGPENEDFMTILARLERWKEQGAISAEQHAHLAGLSRGEPFSIFLELTFFSTPVWWRSLPDSAGLSAHGRSNSVTSSS